MQRRTTRCGVTAPPVPGAYHGGVSRAQARIDLDAFARFALCGSLMTFVLAVAQFGFDGTTPFRAVTWLVAGGVAGSALYVGFAAWLKVPSFDEYLALVKRMVGRVTGGRA